MPNDGELLAGSSSATSSPGNNTRRIYMPPVHAQQTAFPSATAVENTPANEHTASHAALQLSPRIAAAATDDASATEVSSSSPTPINTARPNVSSVSDVDSRSPIENQNPTESTALAVPRRKQRIHFWLGDECPGSVEDVLRDTPSQMAADTTPAATPTSATAASAAAVPASYVLSDTQIQPSTPENSRKAVGGKSNQSRSASAFSGLELQGGGVTGSRGKAAHTTSLPTPHRASQQANFDTEILGDSSRVKVSAALADGNRPNHSGPRSSVEKSASTHIPMCSSSTTSRMDGGGLETAGSGVKKPPVSALSIENVRRATASSRSAMDDGATSERSGAASRRSTSVSGEKKRAQVGPGSFGKAERSGAASSAQSLLQGSVTPRAAAGSETPRSSEATRARCAALFWDI